MDLNRDQLKEKVKEELKKLTPEQEQEMIEVQNFWLNFIFSCKNKINKEKAIEGVEWLYKISDLKKPQTIFAESPIMCQCIANALKFLDDNGLRKTSVHTEELVNKLRWFLFDKYVNKITDKAIDPSLSEYESKLSIFKPIYYSFANYGSISDYGWVSFYDFFQQKGLIEHEEFMRFKEMLLSGIYDMIQLEDYCIVSSLPTIMEKNEAGNFHCTSGPSVKFEDGYSLFYVNGRSLPRWIWDRADKNEITKEMFIKETNDEIRSGIYEVLGQERVMNLLEAKEIDSVLLTHGNGELETISLFRTTEALNTVKNKPYAWLKRICPSTETVYMTPTNPDFKTAIEAAKFHRPEFVPIEVDYNWDARS